MPTINEAKSFKLQAELTPREHEEQRARLLYDENVRQAVLLLLSEVAKLRDEVNILKGV